MVYHHDRRRRRGSRLIVKVIPVMPGTAVQGQISTKAAGHHGERSQSIRETQCS